MVKEMALPPPLVEIDEPEPEEEDTGSAELFEDTLVDTLDSSGVEDGGTEMICV